MDKLLMPMEFEDDRVFYMEIDPKLFLHEFSSIFYSNYKDILGNRMQFIDANENQVELMVKKENIFGYILAGFYNLVTLYGLEEGGWLKLVYVGEDIFVFSRLETT
ncbi:hypothetical protein HN51_069480 [Arachis hypogaea]